MSIFRHAPDPRMFADRKSAGLALASALLETHFDPPTVVLALPRGGVPVGYEVARALNAPLDVLTVRKVGMPDDPEFAIGAIAPGGVEVRHPSADALLSREGVDFEQLAEFERHELARREHVYRGGAAAPALSGCTAILVDDGLATGLTMLAAVRAARGYGASSVVVAVPVASREARQLLAPEADDVMALLTPERLRSVGTWYRDFDPVEDDEVLALLRSANPSAPRHRASAQ